MSENRGLMRKLPSLYGFSSALLIAASVATFGTAILTAARPAQATTAQRSGETNAFFEAVSIKPSDQNGGGPNSEGRGGIGVARGGGGCGGGPVEITPGRVVFSRHTVFRLIAWAYGLDCSLANLQGLIIGAPAWARSDQFVVQATFPPNFSVPEPSVLGFALPRRYPQVQLMLRNMLAERFKLVMHREKKEVSVLELVVAKGGPKLPLASSDDSVKVATPVGANPLRVPRMSMDAFASTLQDFVREPIVDRTGLKDEYRITFYFSGIEDSTPGSAIPPLFTALEEQLGLKLQRAKSTEEGVVIDQLDKPTAN